MNVVSFFFFFFQAEDGIRDDLVTGVQTCALPIYARGDSGRGAGPLRRPVRNRRRSARARARAHPGGGGDPMSGFLSGAWPWVLTVAGFVFLIVIHEFGHFIAAKATGMRVERFFLFFPPKLVSIKRGETE